MHGAFPADRLEEFPLIEGPWAFLAQKLPVEDLTAAALEDQPYPEIDQSAEPAPDKTSEGLFDAMQRVLYRRKTRHLLLTGLKGVGKTWAVRELARKAAFGEVPFLADHRFLWIDCKNVGIEDSRGCLETILSIVEAQPATVLCLDGLASLIKRPGGGSNKPLLRAAAARPGLSLIGILSKWEFNELIAGDAEMLELFARLEIVEPDEEEAFEIAIQNARRLEQEYELTIERQAVSRAVDLSSIFMLNACHPQKAISVLERCCDHRHYEQTQLCLEPRSVTVEDVTRVVSEITSIPRETVAGETGVFDIGGALSVSVVGQKRAVDAVTAEMQLIKAGLNEPGKPASVLLFAGMTGVGKTELAKQLAELYSTTKQLHTYTMGNFTEPHSVSGIIGVPPGYVGHDQGGRLINELNADPYSVFLLDEAEKAHPNVWKPFLNLFDEGWLVDQRGVKATADRAIFILTTNAGDRQIEQMTKSGKSEDEIAEHVKSTLSKIKQERSSQPVFTPQFLSRLRRLIVFTPLDESAMVDIAKVKMSQMQRIWREKREKSIETPQSLIEAIGRRAHELNEKAGGKEGGRIVRKLITDLVESRIQWAATRDAVGYKSCQKIRLELATDADADRETPLTTVQFLRE